jgi:hypothetical protein
MTSAGKMYEMRGQGYKLTTEVMQAFRLNTDH